MNNKCNKYETLFLFLNKENFSKHLKQCDNCTQEQKKMDAVSQLIKEVKDDYIEIKDKRKILKIACALFFIFFSGVTITINKSIGLYNSVVYKNITAQELGFPTDNLGLILVD